MADILHGVGINAPADKVFAALTEPEGLSGWWTEDVHAEPGVGSVARFRFGDDGFNEMKVLELVPRKRVRWQCVDGPAEWIGTELTFDLTEQNGRTTVMFAHRNWKESVESMHYCSTKWAVFLLSLKSLCETGSGRPYPRDLPIID
jgi:uncharacterized protein YndB with AHSA1/START domain